MRTTTRNAKVILMLLGTLDICISVHRNSKKLSVLRVFRVVGDDTRSLTFILCNILLVTVSVVYASCLDLDVANLLGFSPLDRTLMYS